MAMPVVLLAILSLVLVALTVFLTFTAFVFYQHFRYRHIPGPVRDSFFSGNVPFFRQQKSKGIRTNQVWLNWQREYGSVYVFWVYFTPIVFISDPDMIKKSLVTLNLPKSARVYNKLSYVFGYRCLGRGVLTETNHELWQRKRNVLNPAFHRKYLRNLMEAFNSSCDAFLEKIGTMADGVTEVRMADEFARVTLDVIGKASEF